MTANQLSEVLTATQAELKRRENIDSAAAEMRAILKKYKLTMDDITLDQLAPSGRKKKSATPSKKAKTARDRRAKVQPKHRNPNGPETWSGRGRTPVWVVSICQHENIDLDRFKADPRFAFQG